MKSSTGQLVPGRCGATNLCAYCARLAAVENAECLSIDAMTGAPPLVWAVLTTRSADPDPASFYESRRQLHRAMKRRWPGVEYAALVEFTTGYGPRSGGKRRPHWNLLLKGVPADDVDLVRDVVARVWCQREDASPDAQWVGTVGEAGGLMRYLALHFQKGSQAPPAGWSGHRFMHSRGYFAGGIAAVRELARDQLRYRRVVHEIERAVGPGLLCPGEQYEWADEIHAKRRATTWELVRVHELAPDTRGREVERWRRVAAARAAAP